MTRHTTFTLPFFILLSAVVITGCGGPDLQTEVISANTMVCGMCEDNVEKAVYAVEGVKSVEVDRKSKNVTVMFIPAQTNVQTIERAITDAGYNANDKPRDAGAYEKLDACCKED